MARVTTAADLRHLLAAGSQHPYSGLALPQTGSDALAVVRSGIYMYGAASLHCDSRLSRNLLQRNTDIALVVGV